MNTSSSILPANALNEPAVEATSEIHPEQHGWSLHNLTTLITKIDGNLDQLETLLDIQNDKYALTA